MTFAAPSREEMQQQIVESLEDFKEFTKSLKDIPLPHFEFDVGMLSLERVLEGLINEAQQRDFTTQSARYFCYVIKDIASKLSPEQLDHCIEEVHSITLLSAWKMDYNATDEVVQDIG